METKIIAVANQKGGVGKTTTSINIAAAFAIIEKRTLLIDLDPQGNTSTGLGVKNREKNIYNSIVEGVDLKSIIIQTEIPHLHLIPSSIDLSAAELEISQEKNREFFLKELLKGLEGEYDYVFIDSPPSLGLLTINALTAATSVIIPSQCEFFALEGLSHLLNTVALIKENLNSKLHIDGIVLTMYDKRNNLTALVEKEVRKYLEQKVYNTIIPRNIKLSEAPSHGRPAILYDHKCTGSKSYLSLAREILQRHNDE